MPILNLTLSTAPDLETSRQAAAILLRLTHGILHKAQPLTSIAISHVPPEHWYIGERTLADHGRASFFLDIKITDETNTAAEKAAYIAAVFEEMAALLGPLHEVSYVHIDDARPAAWGYGGLTQQYRAVKKMEQAA
ncbi:tautomerase family protein [Pseudoduganella namucuonensis]|uniref:4-oxalocrotonate tautomerase n=1 Tax=Pseudoduganella namucuonensis TaxID=1035707 RepID=A0A1I7ETX8_9BURK|nr:4-oxalocrotonate tautomerase [Pseudoduganella namucuonensis]SFU27348.1 4-oxalocrotonate tautomerase [Pseudoduganella namucuonensis]